MPAQPRAARALVWTAALLALAAITAAMYAVRPQLDKAHVALVYVLVVLVGTATGGRLIGLTLAAVSFVSFDLLFLPPYGTLVVANPLDWLVLGTFLLTSVVASHLLTRAQERALDASARTAEVQRLAELGAETLNAGVATDALDAIAEVVRSALRVDRCEILAPEGAPTNAGGAEPGFVMLGHAGTSQSAASDDETHGLAAWVADRGVPAALRADHTAQTGTAQWETQGDPWIPQGDVRVLLVPLRARGRAVGVLRIANRAHVEIGAEQREFLRVLSYYAALGVERVRLVAAAERAEAFRQADELKSALIANVSHDLRTPLTTIKALAHRLASSGNADAKSIEEESDRLTRFVGDLLDLSRIAASALPVRAEVNAAEELVDASRQRLAGALQDRTLVVHVDPSAPLILGRFDLVQSVRVLVNLLENALKYSPAHSPVELTVVRRGARLVLEVADRGAGVPPAEEKLIFEPFYRPVGARPDAGGAGLGLAIARGLAEAQDGSVRYAARAGGGSVFTFELPAVDAPALGEAPANAM